jgi:RNA polymerase sigma factor (sigma-70 family)
MSVGFTRRALALRASRRLVLGTLSRGEAEASVTGSPGRHFERSDAEDAAQEALALVFRRLGRLQEPDAIRGWARTIAVREAVRTARRRNQAGIPAELPDTAARQVDVDLSLDIRRRLTQLPAEQRAVLVLRELEGLSEGEVAQLLRLPQRTVKSRLHRARKRFVEGWGR